MKTIILASILSGVCLAEAKEGNAISGAPAKSYYLELVPGEIKSLAFETSTAKFLCNDRLDVRAFESVKNYPSVDSGKDAPVKVINIHVSKQLTGCVQKSDTKKLTSSFTTPKSKSMVHVYVTAEEDIQVKF